MSEDLTDFCPRVVAEAGLEVSKYVGPETPTGQARTRIQLSYLAVHGARKIMTFSIAEWLALGAAVQATAWERPLLPICYDSRCPHERLPHALWPDCPARGDD